MREGILQLRTYSYTTIRGTGSRNLKSAAHGDLCFMRRTLNAIRFTLHLPPCPVSLSEWAARMGESISTRLGHGSHIARPRRATPEHPVVAIRRQAQIGRVLRRSSSRDQRPDPRKGKGKGTKKLFLTASCNQRGILLGLHAPASASQTNPKSSSVVSRLPRGHGRRFHIGWSLLFKRRAG